MFQEPSCEYCNKKHDHVCSSCLKCNNVTELHKINYMDMKIWYKCKDCIDKCKENHPEINGCQSCSNTAFQL